MNSEDVRDKLLEEIDSVIDALSEKTDPANEQYGKAVRNLNTLYQLKMNEDQNIRMHEEKMAAFEVEKLKATKREDNELNQAKDKKIETYLKYGVEVMGLVTTLTFYGIWFAKGFRYEETGSYASTTFRNMIGRFKPGK